MDSAEDIPTVGTKLLSSGCSAIADQLEAAIAQYVALGFPVTTKGPLVPALRRLRQIVAEDSYGTSERDLREAASALLVAGDFASILTVLPATLKGPPPVELVRMFDGSLDLSEYKGAHDLRAQFAFAALLGQGYFNPRLVPSAGTRKSPDFLITVGHTACAVEVKRPANPARMMRKIDEAAAQLRDLGLPGFVILDCSRMHDAYGASTSAFSSSSSLRTTMRDNFFAHTANVIRHCESQARNHMKRDKYSYLIGAVLYIRIAHWLRSDQSAPALLQTHSEGPVMWSSMERGLVGEAVVFTKRIGQLLGGGKSPYRFGVTREGQPIVSIRLNL